MWQSWSNRKNIKDTYVHVMKIGENAKNLRQNRYHTMQQ